MSLINRIEKLERDLKLLMEIVGGGGVSTSDVQHLEEGDVLVNKPINLPTQHPKQKEGFVIVSKRSGRPNKYYCGIEEGRPEWKANCEDVVVFSNLAGVELTLRNPALAFVPISYKRAEAIPYSESE